MEICVSHIQNLVTLDGKPLDSNYWLEKISNQSMDVTQEAAHNRLQLIVLEQARITFIIRDIFNETMLL